MTKNDEKLIAEFEIRMRQLMYLCDTLKSENIQLKQLVSQKNTAIEFLTSETEELKKKYDNLKFAKSFSSENKDDINEAKNRLSKLVRDVDKCISILKG